MRVNILLFFALKLSTSSGAPQKSGLNRIVNGRDASIEDFPFQLSLRRSSVHICGASVLSSIWALTAAHCTHGLSKSPDMFTLRIGSSLRSTGGKVIPVESIFEHPLYDSETMNFDVALLRTQPKMLNGNFVQPIRLPEVDMPIADNTTAIVSGWGHMSSTEEVLSNVLKFATVRMVNQAQCENNLKFHGGITEAMFCAAARNTDACQGDSGGPIQVNGTLIGLVSWGVGCANPLYPGVYTRLAFPNIRHWVRLYTHL